MKKNFILMIVACLLLSSFLVACSPKATPTPQPTAVVVIPVVPTETVATQPTEAKSYSLDELNAMSEDQIRAFLNEKLQRHHSIEWVLKKNFTVDEWKMILGGPEHSDFEATDVERDFLIDWMIKNH